MLSVTAINKEVFKSFKLLVSFTYFIRCFYAAIEHNSIFTISAIANNVMVFLPPQVMIHSRDTPAADTNALMIPPGTEAQIALTQKQV